MEIINPFEVKGNWYKGNIHTHTQNSDGAFSPEDTCKIYASKGYDFLAITDHNKITMVMEAPDNLLMIESLEVDTENFHIIGIGMKDIFEKEGMNPQQLIDIINQQDAAVIVAHPYWSGLTSHNLLLLNGYHGIEVYNQVCQRTVGKGYSNVHIDEVLQTGRKIFCFAVDDTHFEDDIGCGFIMVKAKECGKMEILESIKKGYFYSSTGLLIKDVVIEKNKIKVHCSHAETVDFIGCNATGKRISGKKITYAEYNIKGIERYIRIEITDSRRRKAWTNPIIFV